MPVFNNALAGAAGQSSSDAGYKIERSLRFNSSDNAYLSKNFGTAGNRKKWTYSTWVKRTKLGAEQIFAIERQQLNGNGYEYMRFDSNDRIDLYLTHDGSNWSGRLQTEARFRDVSAWMHVVLVCDIENSTAGDRIRLYVNGERVTVFNASSYPATSEQTTINSTGNHHIGRLSSNSNYFGGYLAETHFLDGIAISSPDGVFGEFSADTGVWNSIRYTGDHNSTLAKHQGDWAGDVSGSAYNSSHTADKAFDGSTSTSAAAGSGGTLTFTPSPAITGITKVRIHASRDSSASTATITLNGTDVSSNWSLGDNKTVEFTETNLTSLAWTTQGNGQWFGVRKIEIYYDGAYHTLRPGTPGVNGFYLDFSDNSSNAALGNDAAGSNNWTVNNLVASAPGLSTANQGFNVATYSGNGSNGRAIDLGFQPDFLWIKRRDGSLDHGLWDSVRGSGKELYSNRNYAEGSTSNLASFTSTGFTANNNALTNGNGNSYVAWAWKAGGSSVSNTNGTISSSVSANNTYGFSVVAYTGNSTAGATIGHGLSTAPSLIIIKNRSRNVSWAVGHSGNNGFANGNQLRLDSNAPVASSEEWFNNTNPTSSVFTVKNNYEVNYSGDNYVAYCWSQIPGFSKFGTYTGDSPGGNTNTVTITTGFAPKFILIKRTGNGSDGDTSYGGWGMYTSTLSNQLMAHCTGAEGVRGNCSGSQNIQNSISFNSDGFSVSTPWYELNDDNVEYIYAAFADAPDGPIIDSLIDTPTDYDDGTNIGGNYATLNSLTPIGSNCTFSNGNLDVSIGSSSSNGNRGIRAISTIGMTSGKWYCEHQITGGSTARSNIGVISDTNYGWDDGSGNYFIGSGANDYIVWSHNGTAYTGSSQSNAYGVGWAVGDIIGCAFDADEGKMYIYKNGTVMNNGTPSHTGLTDGPYFFIFSEVDSTISANFGQRGFKYPPGATGGPPATYKALCTKNLDDPLIADPSTTFDTFLYTGDGASSRNLTLPLAADFLWIKKRSAAGSHQLVDTVRGNNSVLHTNSTNEAKNPQTQFSGGGISSLSGTTATLSAGTSNNDNTNANNTTFVGWAWGGCNLATTSSSSYNQTRTWSDNAVGGRSDEPIEDLFDGQVNTFAQNPSGGSNPNNLIVNFSPGLAYTSSVEVYPYNASSVAINNGSQNSTTNQQWNTVVSGSGTLTKLDFQRNHTNGCAISAIRVDGKILINPGVIPVGSLNSSAYAQDDVYSDDLTTANSASGSVTNAFDGNLTTQYSTQTGGAYSSPITFTPSGGLSYTSSVKVYCPNGQMAARINNGSWISFSTNAVIATGSGTITTIEVTERRSNAGFGLYAIEVDGKILVDSNITPPNVPSVPSTVRANQTAGFSIVTATLPNYYTNYTIGHGLNATPHFIFGKNRSSANQWDVYHQDEGTGKLLRLNSTDGVSNATANQDSYYPTAPDSSVFGFVGNNSTMNFVWYVFSEVENYSKFGTYIGNNSLNGPFVYTGFRPAWVMVKGTGSSNTYSWVIVDSKRSTYNPTDHALFPNSSNLENSLPNYGDRDFYIDLLSNGFKLRFDPTSINTSGGNYVWAAFAEHPLKYARAR